MNTHNHPNIETVRTGSLKPNPRNARTHSKKQISQIAASIKQYGWLGVIIVCPSSGHLAQTECGSFGGLASSVGFSLGGKLAVKQAPMF